MGASYASMFALLFAFYNSFAQELQTLDSNFVQEQQQPAAPVQTAPLDSISQLPPAPALSSSSVASSSSAAIAYKFYEDYLDSAIVFAKNVFPGKQKFETQKAAINAETLQAKSEYERQQDYDARIAGFDKEKQKRIKNLEKEYQKEEKNRIKKLSKIINHKEDIQPEWAGILKRDTTIEGYEERRARLGDKISIMEKRIAQVIEILAGLDLLSKGDLETMNKKNRIYMARLERAKELMKDYIVQNQALVLGTEKKRIEMALGSYDVETQEFELSMNDASSQTVPFDYIGKIKINPQQAQAIDRKTDDFTVSLNYINYPFILNNQKIYPGLKKANVFYKDQEFQNAGVFRNVPGFESAPGYAEWALHADSIISGKLTARNLDSMYAMKKILPKIAPVGTFWERNKNIVRGTLLGLSAVSAGLAIWQNSEADSKTKDIKKTFNEAEKVFLGGKQEDYEGLKKKYNKGKDELRSAENLRNGFYISAGVFGVAGIATLCF